MSQEQIKNLRDYFEKERDELQLKLEQLKERWKQLINSCTHPNKTKYNGCIWICEDCGWNT